MDTRNVPCDQENKHSTEVSQRNSPDMKLLKSILKNYAKDDSAVDGLWRHGWGAEGKSVLFKSMATGPMSGWAAQFH